VASSQICLPQLNAQSAALEGWPRIVAARPEHILWA